jgi:hypothetical protein
MLLSKSRILFIIFISLSSLFLSGQNNSAQVTEVDFFKDTNPIFVGRLVEKESYWSDDRRFILTRHIFQVQDSVKGDPGYRTEIIEYGGRVGELAQDITHTARYQLNREYLVFSYLDALQRNRTLAGPLGQFQVINGGSDQRVVRIYPAHPLASTLGGQPLSTFQELNVFSSKLRATLEELTISEE